MDLRVQTTGGQETVVATFSCAERAAVSTGLGRAAALLVQLSESVKGCDAGLALTHQLRHIMASAMQVVELQRLHARAMSGSAPDPYPPGFFLALAGQFGATELPRDQYVPPPAQPAQTQPSIPRIQ